MARGSQRSHPLGHTEAAARRRTHRKEALKEVAEVAEFADLETQEAAILEAATLEAVTLEAATLEVKVESLCTVRYTD